MQALPQDDNSYTLAVSSKEDRVAQSHGAEPITISLVIPAYNEECYIGETLDSVFEAKARYRNPASIEVIVVDNHSTDRTQEIARSYGATVISEAERRIASVRNSGANAATGRIVGFLDADSRITPDMFTSIDRVMSSGRYVGGGTMIRLDRRSLGLLATYCVTVIPARYLLGVSCGLLYTEKRTFELMGGFDESLYCAEDSKFALELKRYGKPTGLRFKVLSDDYVITSTRSFDRLGDWYYLRNVPKAALRGMGVAFRDKAFCDKFWYDVNR